MSFLPLQALSRFVFRCASTGSTNVSRGLDGRSLRFEPLETRQLLAAIGLSDFSVAEGTGEKPQSKTWEHAGRWWTVMPNSSGTWIWRLDGTSWTPTLRLTTNNDVKADVKAAGDLAHVLLFDAGSTQLASVEYVAAGSYAPWTMRPGLVNVPLSGTETATLDLDSTGRLWIAADSGSNVQVRYSDGVYANWSGPITVASGINSDDISVITAMPNGSIGVLWSNQNTKRFGFRTHHDGDAPGVWSADELPASQSALNVGGGMADDHLNVAVASDGTLYAAVKTSYDSSSRPKIALLVRRPSGMWGNLYSVDTSGTRPIVVLNEAAGRLIVAYAASEGTANIMYRETSTSSISFGPRQTLISGSLQNVSSTKQSFTDDVVFMASNGSKAKSVLFSFGAVQVNQPPVVDAGLNQTILAGAAAALNGTVTDDGLPSAIAASWLKASGPGVVTFANAAAIDTSASFSATGTYVLRLSASDGQFSAQDEVTIVVQAEQQPPPVGGATVTITFQDGVAPFGGYNGTRDTKIRAQNAAANYGADAAMELDGSPDIATLIGWDVSAIPAGSTVLSAAIELYVTNVTAHNYDILALDRAWQELGATWNQAAAGLAWSVPGAAGSGDRGATSLGGLSARKTGAYSVTLNAAGRAIVEEWINDPSNNHGVIFQNYAVSDGMDFRSSETGVASQRPKLVVTYQPPAEPQPPEQQQPLQQQPEIVAPQVTEDPPSDQGEVTVVIDSPTTGSTGLIGHWTLDSAAGNVAGDSSGLGHAGSLIGAPQMTAGVLGSAMSFSGTNRVVINNAEVLNPTNQITLAAWIKPSASGTQYVVKKGRHNETDGYELSLSSGGKAFVRFNQASSGDAFRVNSTTSYPTSGSAWLHVAATYDGSVIKLYLNGALQASKNAAFQIASNSLPLAIGAEDDGYRGFRGAIDDVRLYNRALTADEIASLLNNS